VSQRQMKETPQTHTRRNKKRRALGPRCWRHGSYK